MKKLILFLFSVISIVTMAQEKVVWDYPVKPGSAEWAKFNTRQEMVDACQIPNEILNNIATEILLEICLKYPLLHDIMFYNNSQNGFNCVAKPFNGINELFKREDIGVPIIKKYQMLNAGQVSTLTTSLERGKFMASLVLFELIISQEEILVKLSKEEKILLAKEAKIKFNDKMEYVSNYSLIGTQSTPFLMGRIMKADGFEDFNLFFKSNNSCKDFLETGNTNNPSVLYDLNNIVIEYVE